MLAVKLKQFLDKYHVSYLELNHERGNAQDAIQDLNIEHSKVLRAIPLTDGQNCLLAVLPFNSQLNIKGLTEERKKYQCLTDEEVNHIFYDCESGSLPPFGEPYGVKVIVDKDIENLTEVYFESGCHNSKIYMTIDDFCFLTNGAPKRCLTVENADEKLNEVNEEILTIDNIETIKDNDAILDNKPEEDTWYHWIMKSPSKWRNVGSLLFGMRKLSKKLDQKSNVHSEMY